MKMIYLAGFAFGLCDSYVSAWSSFLGFKAAIGSFHQMGIFFAFVCTGLTVVLGAATPKMMMMRKHQAPDEETQMRNNILVVIWTAALVFDTLSSIAGMLIVRANNEIIGEAVVQATASDWISAWIFGLIMTAGPLISMYFYEQVQAEGGFFACLFGFFSPTKGD